MSVATAARVHERRLGELEARRDALEAELARPEEAALELARLDHAIREKEREVETARGAARRELARAREEHEAATAALLEALPLFLDAHERAAHARARVDARARAADEAPPPRLYVTGRPGRALVDRWRRAAARGFDL